MKALVCIDRDGTLIYDSKEHLFLGSQGDWKEKIEILPSVAEGIQKLREISDVGIYMITNQSGVAIKDLLKLTKEKAQEVCVEVLRRMEAEGAKLDGYFMCPHVDPEYVRAKPDVTYEESMVCECECIKPRLGMVFSALEKEGVTQDNVNVYVIGDRASDAETAINIGGKGIIIPFNEPGEKEKLGQGQDRYVAEDMIEAAKFIIESEKEK